MGRLLGFVAIAVFSVLLIQSVQGYRLTDNLYFAMTNDSIRCIDLILPDDSGSLGMGEYEYVITCTSNWSDLTEQVVRTDENNTARIPICFSGFGRSDGDCSPPFRIGISSMVLGIDREWNGGVCISRFPDVDVSDEEPENEDDVREILNDNVDLFDVGFPTDMLYADPGEPVVFRLMVQSYASLTIDLEIADGIGASPSEETVTTSPERPYDTVYFTVTAPSRQGEHMFEVVATIRNCNGGSFCSKKASGTVVVGEDSPEEGFSVSVFPKSINVKKTDPVSYALTIHNYGESKVFSTEISISPETDSDFPGGEVIAFDDETVVVNFTVTPGGVSSFYEIEVSVEHGGIVRKADAFLSTNEMLTDSMREGDYVKSLDPELSDEVDSSLDSWYDQYRTEDYGDGLDDYGSLNDKLDELRNQAGSPRQDTYVPDDEPQDQEEETRGFDIMWLVIPVITVAAVVLLFIFFRKSGKTEEDGQDYF